MQKNVFKKLQKRRQGRAGPIPGWTAALEGHFNTICLQLRRLLDRAHVPRASPGILCLEVPCQYDLLAATPLIRHGPPTDRRSRSAACGRPSCFCAAVARDWGCRLAHMVAALAHRVAASAHGVAALAHMVAASAHMVAALAHMSAALAHMVAASPHIPRTANAPQCAAFW